MPVFRGRVLRPAKGVIMRMRIVCVVLVCCMAHVMVSSSWGAERERLVFGCTPWKEPQVLREVHKPLLDYLSRVLGVELVFHVAADYAELGERLEARTIDAGMFSPNAYVQAKKRYPGLQYLASIQKLNVLGQVQDHYRGYIVVLASSSLFRLEDLRGKRFAFTDMQSTSGYLYPRLLLQRHGLDPDSMFSRTFMLKKHDKVLMAVLKGSVDAGACFDDAFREMNEKHPGTFRVLAQTPDIPFDAYAAGSHVSAELVQKLRAALVDFVNAPERRPEMLGSPHSFVVRSDAFYDVVREANREAE